MENSGCPKMEYESPNVEIVYLTSPDIITTSGEKDSNQGEWDTEKNSNG